MWLLFPLSVFALIIIPNFADIKLRYREFNSLPDVTYSESDQFRLQQIFLTVRTVLFKWLYFKKYLKCLSGNNNHYTCRTNISLTLDACCYCRTITTIQWLFHYQLFLGTENEISPTLTKKSILLPHSPIFFFLVPELAPWESSAAQSPETTYRALPSLVGRTLCAGYCVLFSFH